MAPPQEAKVGPPVGEPPNTTWVPTVYAAPDGWFTVLLPKLNAERVSTLVKGVKVGSDPVKAALVHVHGAEQSLLLLMENWVAEGVPHTYTPVPDLDKVTRAA